MLTIDKLTQDDLEAFTKAIWLFEQVFEMENFELPEPEHLKKILAKDSFFVFVAMLDDKVVGALTGYVLEQYYATRPLAYIYDLAVDNSFQRRGIGRKLINAVKGYCQQRGFEEVFVQADRVEDHAVSFYRSTQPTEEEDVLHFYYALNGGSGS